MSLADKLQLKGAGLHVIRAPEDVDLGDVEPVADPDGPVLLFARDRAALTAHAEPVLAAAREDRLAWIAYPKGGQLGTDLNRDVLWEALSDEGIRPVRQVSIDAVWSAMRFRPAKG